MLCNNNKINIPSQDSDPKQIETPEVLISEEFQIYLKYVTDESKLVHFPKAFLQKTVKELKILLFPEEISSNKTVKLIYKGKLLQDCDNLSAYSLIENEVLHVVLTNENEPNNIPIHLENNNNHNNNNNNEMNENLNNDFFFQIERHGFEKLIDDPYIDEDIESLREIHHVGYQIDKYSFSRMQMIEKEENLILTNNHTLLAQLRKIQQARILKEKGTYVHFIIGCVLGYFFNILILLIMVFLKYPKNALVGTLAGFLLKLFVISFQNVKKTSN